MIWELLLWGLQSFGLYQPLAQASVLHTLHELSNDNGSIGNMLSNCQYRPINSKVIAGIIISQGKFYHGGDHVLPNWGVRTHELRHWNDLLETSPSALVI